MKNDQVVAIFTYVDDFLACLQALKKSKWEIANAFSPVRIPEMQEILKQGKSLTRLFTLVGGIIGGTGLVGLAAYAHLRFSLIVWGKPVLAWVPWLIVAFEGTILFASLFAFVSWVFKSGLPQPSLDAGYGAAFSGSRFGIVVNVGDGTRDEVESLLKEHGAEEVADVAP